LIATRGSRAVVFASLILFPRSLKVGARKRLSLLTMTVT
jgi:hypothetical protein